jgi:hypothetical protein
MGYSIAGNLDARGPPALWCSASMIKLGIEALMRYWKSVRFLGRIARTSKRMFMLPAVPADTQVLVVSPGGVGTTMVLEHLRRFVRVNDPFDRDGLKHLPRPPKFGSAQTRTVFLSGRPDDIFDSLNRRGWVDGHGSLLGSFATVLSSPQRKREHFAAALGRQRDAWSNYRGEIMFIDYGELWERLPELERFLELEKTDFLRTFPQRRRRTLAPNENEVTIS